MTGSRKLSHADPDPHAAALSQVERDTAGQQERVHRQAVREGQEKPAEPATPADKVARDTARYEALAREHGADLGEEAFDEALRKVGKSADRADRQS